MDNKVIVDLGSAAIGGFVAEITTYPIKSLKNVFQTNDHTLTKVIRDLGKRGFYRGTLPTFMSKGVSVALKYTLYQSLKVKISEKIPNKTLAKVVSGATGGAIGVIFTQPMFVWMLCLQRGEVMKPQYAFRGVIVNIFRTIPLYSMLFPLYDSYYVWTKDPFLSSLLTTMTTTTVLQPIEYIRTNHAAGRLIGLKTPIKTLYRGTGLAFIRNSAHLSITMILIENIKSYYFKN